MEINLKIVGVLLVMLSLLHVVLPHYFGWKMETKSLSLITRQILYVHTFFIALMVLLMGILCLAYSRELMFNTLGRIISLGLAGFWLIRLIFQFLVYSPDLWKGKKFETAVHVIFSFAWIYISIVFILTYITNLHQSSVIQSDIGQ